MSKFTDAERHDLAARMRGGYDVTGRADGLCWLNGTLFGLGICAGSEEEVREGIARLADLIDPGAPECPEAAATEARHRFDCIELLHAAMGMLGVLEFGASNDGGIDRERCRELHDEFADCMREAYWGDVMR